MVPLFSLRTSRDLGIGDFGDLPPFFDWMASCGLEVLQMLPLNELSPGETSPYQALSGLAADPVYLALDAWDDVVESDEAQRLLGSASVQRDLASWRDAPNIAYQPIRAFKQRLLRLGYERFVQREWARDSPRAQAFRHFGEDHAEWLDPYAQFRLFKTLNHGSDWATWPTPYRDRDAQALRQLDVDHADELRYLRYLQWALWEQWVSVRRDARRRGIRIMGDLPFLVSRDSADVWSRPQDFDLNHTVGAPKDPINPEQDWGLPLFRWSVMEPAKFPWWRLRLRIARAWFDLIRLDHVVGFFRAWVMAPGESSHFEPPDEPEQIRRGDVFLRMIIEAAGECIPIAEDLGTIPPFVPVTLERLGIAGHKVFRWERYDGVYHEPAHYPFVSLATPGTHDTSTLADWWNTSPDDERRAFLRLFSAEDAARAQADRAGVFTDEWHRMVLDRLIGSGSGLVILPIQDVLGHQDQVNVPATVGPHNWTYRLPCTIADLNRPPLAAKAQLLRELLARHGRAAGSAAGATSDHRAERR